MSKRNILIVDDDISFGATISMILKRRGFSVSATRDGMEALDMAIESWNNQAPYDLILADLLMPKMTGCEIVETLNEASVTIPVLIMTGYCSSSTVSQLQDLGCKGFLLKPFDANELIKKIDTVLETNN